MRVPNVFQDRMDLVQPHDPREAQRVAALVARAGLHDVEGHLQHDLRLDQPGAAEIFDRVGLEPLGQRGDLGVGQPAIGLADVQQRLFQS